MLKNFLSPRTRYILFALILALGLFTRVWEFSAVPPGLNQDEASIGVEAYSLYRYGVDRNNVSYPVNFISWGNGMDALYGYVLIPFVALLGLTPVAVRMPSLVAGLLTLPLVYWVGKKMFDVRFGLLAMFFLALSPWHIILSRWGINENISPFVFLLGFGCFLKSTRQNYWFVAGCMFLGLCLYAYGAAYLVVPLFLLGAIITLVRYQRVSRASLGLGVALVAILAIPAILFVLINTFRWESVHLGALTVPRLPAQARFEAMSGTTSENKLATWFNRASGAYGFLSEQTDGLVVNTVEPYGYFYAFTFPLALFGALLLVRSVKGNPPARWLLLSWLLAAMSIGILIEANVNRYDLIFIPLITSVAVFVYELNERWSYAVLVATILLLLGLIGFTQTYHGDKYRRQASGEFFDGVLPAIEYARDFKNNPICISVGMAHPYIFVMFAEPLNPAQYASNIEYVDATEQFRHARRLGRYAFGMENCSRARNTIYIFDIGSPPFADIKYSVRSFGRYQVYVP